MPRYVCEIAAEVPRGVTLRQWEIYVRDSVASNIGMLRPEEPLFHMDRGSVYVGKVWQERP